MKNLEPIFENEHIVIFDKPAGVLSVPGRFQDGRSTIQSLFQKKILPIHRLDFETSGIIMYAKSTEAQRIASSWFESHEIQKTYEAYTEANEIPEVNKEFIWKSKLLRGKKRAYESPHGKEAITHAKVIEELPKKILLWSLKPKTGRSHQLRFHLFSKGFPILGDILYSSKHPLSENQIALRAVKLNLQNCGNHQSLELPNEISISNLKTYFPL